MDSKCHSDLIFTIIILEKTGTLHFNVAMITDSQEVAQIVQSGPVYLSKLKKKKNLEKQLSCDEFLVQPNSEKQFVGFCERLTMRQHRTKHLYSWAFISEKRKHVHTRTCTQMITATFFMIAPKWRQSRCLSAVDGHSDCGTSTPWMLLSNRKT